MVLYTAILQWRKTTPFWVRVLFALQAGDGMVTRRYPLSSITQAAGREQRPTRPLYRMKTTFELELADVKKLSPLPKPKP